MIKSDLPAAVSKLKRTVTGGEIYCFGGAELAKSLMLENLIDEYYLMVMPKVLGCGKRLFAPRYPSHRSQAH